MKRAVLFLSMGGPETQGEIASFLFRLFSDPAIIGLPAIFRYPLAALLAGLRMRKSRAIYRLIGGGSPLRQQTEAQATAVEKRLGEGYRCFVGMRYAKPPIQKAVENILAWGAEEVILFPLYPQRSTTTTDTALQMARQLLNGQGYTNIRSIISFPDNKGLTAYFAAQLKGAYACASANGNPRILFSAHGLPEHIVRHGDPYPNECLQTAQAILTESGLQQADHELCYQSRLGPLPWIKPFSDEVILCAARSHQPVILVPISFVCEHIETLYEMDMLYRDLALNAGCPYFERLQTPGLNEGFILGLADCIRNINYN